MGEGVLANTLDRHSNFFYLCLNMTLSSKKFALTAALGLAIIFTLNACDKGGDGKLLECIADESGKCTTKFEYDKQNRIVKVNDETITYADNLVTIGTKKYVINGNTVTVDGEQPYTIDKDGYIVSICGDEECTSLTYKDGNLIESQSAGGEYASIYSYDDKKSPFSNSNTPKWVIQLLPSMGYDPSKNNLLANNWTEGGSKGEWTYKYEYDSDGFPTKKKSVNGNEEKTIASYTYR
jgi:hypothetical protein